MDEVTEIYSCKDGQQLKEGKLEVSQDIRDKQDAEADARQKCQRDNTIKKVAYYRLNGMGDFRIFYTYANPNCVSKPPPGADTPKKKKKRRKKKPPSTLLGRIKKFINS